MTNPKEYGILFEGLPTEISALCQVVQGVLIHIFWAERLGVRLSEERKREVNIRQIARKLAGIRKMSDQPLTVARPLEKRLVGNCRDFSTMLCAMLRHQHVPSRARCGFATYFGAGKYEDHWVCEYWKASQRRWMMVDAQLDSFQRRVLQIKFDPCDMPSSYFLPAGKAWQLCRAGQVDPDRFGIFDMHGIGFIQGNLLRDMASLNKMELLPWDGWGLIEKEQKALSADDIALLDYIAALTLGDNNMFHEMRSTYENNPRLRVPSVVRSYTATGVQTIKIADEDEAAQVNNDPKNCSRF